MLKRNALFLILIFVMTSCGVDTGDGSDGACISETFSSSQRTYNCQSLNLSTDISSLFSASGGSSLLIKVVDDVRISGNLALNGGSGQIGNSGGVAGAGGSNGGACDFPLECGLNAGANDGSGDGAGVGGVAGDDPTFFSTVAGGGGAGGSFGTVGTAGAVGAADAGTTAGTGGAIGGIYGATTTWESSFPGGSGGGAGGFGEANGAALRQSGTGGGGGGALRIVAGGNITIDGDISANGGDGGSPETGGDNADGGCGGAGSGGAIWLQAKGNITISGIVSAQGGNGDDCTDANEDGGAGGNGGAGRIRLDDGDGAISVSGTVNPAAVTNTIGNVDALLSDQREYDDDIDCGAIPLNRDSRGGPPRGPLTFCLGFLLAILLKLYHPRKS